jgi:hypothetical protein
MNKAILLFALLPLFAFGQAPETIWIHPNSIQAKITANGNLFTVVPNGGFQVPVVPGSANTKTLFRGIFPWIGGYDPAGNLRIAAAQLPWSFSDFRAGVAGQPGSGRILHVTKSDILAHLADYADNGVIDQPIDDIMDWPKPFLNYWGGGSQQSWLQVAPFYDYNGSGLYEPEAGEHPCPPIITWESYVPDEILFFSYHDSIVHPHTAGLHLGMQVFCTLFAFDCPEEPALDNTLFAYYKFYFTQIEKVTDLYFGFFIDFEIGNPNDDFVGTYNEYTCFAYNGDANDENGFGSNPPFAAITMIVPPTDTFGTGLGANCIPVYKGSPAGAVYPAADIEFQRYLIARFRDGTPLTPQGTGYNPGSGLLPLRSAFPGDLSNPAEWSEISAGNTPGDRRVVFASGPTMMRPFTTNEMMVAFHWSRDTTNFPQGSYDQLKRQADWMGINVTTSLAEIPDCLTRAVDIKEPEITKAKIFPNPATSIITIQAGKENIAHASVIGTTGNVLLCRDFPVLAETSATLSLPPLPAGLYLLLLTEEGGGKQGVRFMIAN